MNLLNYIKYFQEIRRKSFKSIWCKVLRLLQRGVPAPRAGCMDPPRGGGRGGGGAAAAPQQAFIRDPGV